MEELYLKMENKEVEGLKAEESDVLVDAITLGWVGGQREGRRRSIAEREEEESCHLQTQKEGN